jgi:hypothetical protein
MHAGRKSSLPSIERIAPVAGLGALLLAGPAAALDFNPIDFLPLTIHARTSCLDGTVSYPQGVFEGDLFHSDGETRASCHGAVVQNNTATQSGVMATCDAAADLEAGTLKVVAVGRSFVDDVQRLRAGASASAYLYDTLTVEGSWEGVRNVELQLAVDGAFLVSLSNELADDLQSSRVQGRLELLSESNAQLEIADLVILKSNGGAPFVFDAVASGGAAWETNAVDEEFDPADVRFTLSAVFPATPVNRTFSFLAWLKVSSSMGYTGPSTTSAEGIADFGDTARLSLIAPADVTVTSSSGRFLTAPAPSASCLGSAALGTLAGLASRRARSRRAR